MPGEADTIHAGYGAFLRGLIDNPRGVSAPTPSSPELARAIAAELDIARPGLVLELGPGTGVVTQALLARGIAGECILAIEQDSNFAALVQRRFPTVDVRCGDALAFEQHLPANDVPLAAVVSGLPLLLLPLPVRQALLRRALARQPPQGSFIQLSYGWRPPVPPPPGVTLRCHAVWRNFPPGFVWTYRAG